MAKGVERQFGRSLAIRLVTSAALAFAPVTGRGRIGLHHIAVQIKTTRVTAPAKRFVKAESSSEPAPVTMKTLSTYRDLKDRMMHAKQFEKFGARPLGPKRLVRSGQRLADLIQHHNFPILTSQAVDRLCIGSGELRGRKRLIVKILAVLGFFRSVELEAQILLDQAPLALELGRMAIAAVFVALLLAVGLAVEWWCEASAPAGCRLFACLSCKRSLWGNYN